MGLSGCGECRRHSRLNGLGGTLTVGRDPTGGKKLVDEATVRLLSFWGAPLAEPVVTTVDRDTCPAAWFVELERGNGTLGATSHDDLREGPSSH
jgi:hypothetical protein